MARLYKTVLLGDGPDLPRRRPPHGGAAARRFEIRSAPDAHPGRRHARDVVPPPEESLGGVHGERHAVREPAESHDTTLAELDVRTGRHPSVVRLRDCTHASLD